MSRPIVFACLLLTLVQSAFAGVPMSCPDPVLDAGCHGQIVQLASDIGCELRCAQCGPAVAPLLASPAIPGAITRAYDYLDSYYVPPDQREIYHPPIDL